MNDPTTLAALGASLAYLGLYAWAIFRFIRMDRHAWNA